MPYAVKTDLVWQCQVRTSLSVDCYRYYSGKVMGRLGIRLSVSCIVSNPARLSTLSDLTLKCSIEGDVANRNPVGSTLDACAAALAMDPAPKKGTTQHLGFFAQWH